MLEVTEFGAENGTPLRIWPINNQNVCIFLRSVCIKKKTQSKVKKKMNMQKFYLNLFYVAYDSYNNIEQLKKYKKKLFMHPR